MATLNQKKSFFGKLLTSFCAIRKEKKQGGGGGGKGKWNALDDGSME